MSAQTHWPMIQEGGPPLTRYQRLAQRRGEAEEKLRKAILAATLEYTQAVEQIKAEERQT